MTERIELTEKPISLAVIGSEVPVTRTPRTFTRGQFLDLIAGGLIRPNKAAFATLARFGTALESASVAPLQQLAVKVAGEIVDASINPQDSSKIEVELFDDEFNRYTEYLEERFKRLETEGGGLVMDIVNANINHGWHEALEASGSGIKETLLDFEKRERARREIQEINDRFANAQREWNTLTPQEKRRRLALLLRDSESRRILGSVRAMNGELSDDMQVAVWVNYQERLSKEPQITNQPV